MSIQSSSSSLSSFLFVFSSLCLFLLLLFLGGATGQAADDPSTDPDEVAALNEIFDGWGISSSESNSSTNTAWNTTGDPCSGAALNDIALNDEDFTPGIKCNCGNTTCHITELKVRGIGLSGIIPKQLGIFKDLTSLKIGMNSFSGTVPEELGNLTNLRMLLMDSLGLGVSGEIPQSFANLKELQTLWIFDNNFTGSIPEFIGSLTQLNDLRLYGNSLQGPVSPSFTNLPNLTYLHIGDLLDSTLNLEMFVNISSLKTLILRNNLIADTIPSSISLTNLILLDLSFNNLTGTIPQSLFNLPNLQYLFLGNNSLSGSLPTEKSSNISYIDLSYNELSGTFPSWVDEIRENLYVF